MEPTSSKSIVKYQGVLPSPVKDILAVEEPLEISLNGTAVAVTMRTPGHDEDLTAGFLHTEGIVKHFSDIHTLQPVLDDISRLPNKISVTLRPGATFHPDHLKRNFYTSSSCGVCGKASLQAVRVNASTLPDDWHLPLDYFYRLPQQLRASQKVFETTGGLHAAAIFDASGALQVLREDVGRHNAVDKSIGALWRKRLTPLHRHVLMVSGRTSFEIMQKAAVAGLPIVCAVSAPSSLAVQVALEFNMTLIGFLRDNTCNIYTGEHRIKK